MPTVIAQIPTRNLSGTEQTPYVLLNPAFTHINVTSQATDAVHSDPLNSMDLIVLASPSGSDADAREIFREPWVGGMTLDKFGGGGQIPRKVDITFNVHDVAPGEQVAIRAIVNRTFRMGATITGLP